MEIIVIEIEVLLYLLIMLAKLTVYYLCHNFLYVSTVE